MGLAQKRLMEYGRRNEQVHEEEETTSLQSLHIIRFNYLSYNENDH